MQVIGRSARMGRHHKRHETAEINLTSMIDMMTILVFFLLVHGGFVRLALLELNLPAAQSQASEEPPSFQLEITVRASGIEVGDRTVGLLSRIEKNDRVTTSLRSPNTSRSSRSSFPRRRMRRCCSSPTSPTTCSYP